MDKPLIIIGAGGHGRVVLDLLLVCGAQVIGITDSNKDLHGTSLFDIPILGNDEIITEYAPDEVYLANGIGSTKDVVLRRQIYQNWCSKDYTFPHLIHPSAVISSNGTSLCEGVQVMAGSIVQANVTIDENSIVNTNVSLDHDCKVAAHVHIAPGCTISGGVEIGHCGFIGAGATVVANCKLQNNCVIGAGSVVLEDVGANECVVGNPAKVKTNE